MEHDGHGGGMSQGHEGNLPTALTHSLDWVLHLVHPGGDPAS